MRQLVLTSLILPWTIFSMSAQTIYVDIKADGDNDGSRWRDAYTSLHDALEMAPDNASIWVARGTYNLKSKKESYVIKKALKIYGGFKGDETALSQRDVEKNISDLSGDVLGDDNYNKADDKKDDNSMHVIVIENGLSEVVLDGLTIRGGETLFLEDESNFTDEYNGGGVLSLGASFSIINCTFYENYADSQGGAIFIDPTPGVEVLIENSTFRDNGSGKEGGTIMVHTSNAQMTIRNSIFDNSFSERGGIVRFRGEGSVLKIEKSDFKEGLSTTWGGAISVNKALEFTITDCIVEDNKAFSGGGGVYMFNIKTATIDDCVIKNNEADGAATNESYGGGIFVGDFEGTLYGTNVTITNTDIINNKCNYLGGGIAIELAKVGIINSRMHDNVADRAGGGAIVFLEGDLSLANVEVNKNTSEDGAGLYFQNTGDYLIEDCEINNNEASSAGGGIFVDLESDGILPIQSSFIEDNSSGFSGGGIFINEGTTEINNSDFESNQSEYGGAISNNYGSTAIISNTRFIKNTSVNNGGALEGHDGAIYKVSDCEFSKNSALDGGAFSCETNSSASIVNSIFEENIADAAGGALYFFASSNLEVDNCSFENNNAAFSGALEIEGLGTKGSILNSEFIRNKANVEGGALSCEGGAGLNAFNSKFENNECNGTGGAIVLSTDSIPGIEHSIDACIFNNNKALDSEDDGGYGAAIQIWDSNINIQNSLFTNNRSDSGGTVSLTESDGEENVVSITNCTFAKNQNSDNGTFETYSDVGDDKVNLVVQNSILADQENILSYYDIEPVLRSNGGNLCFNNSMIDYFTHAKDQNEIDPIFKSNNNDFRLSNNSPAINAGVNANAPAKDLLGYDRDLAVDIGAYESQEVTSVFNEVIPAGNIILLPNPVADVLRYKLESDWYGTFDVAVINIVGQVMWQGQHTKYRNDTTEQINVSQFRSGSYIIQIRKDDMQSNQAFIKI